MQNKTILDSLFSASLSLTIHSKSTRVETSPSSKTSCRKHSRFVLDSLPVYDRDSPPRRREERSRRRDLCWKRAQRKPSSVRNGTIDRGLGTAFKAAFVCDPAHFLAHARKHARTHVDPVVPLNWLFPRQGGNEEGTNASERAGAVTGEGNSSHRNQAALCQRQNGRNSIGRGSSTREDQFPRHNDALVSNGVGEKRASSKS